MYNFNTTLPHRSTWILERTLWKRDIKYVVGVDEVGKGAIAGPLVVAAVVLPIHCRIKNLNDSKVLAPHEREELSKKILKTSVAHVVVAGTNEDIDQEGIAVVNRRLFLESFDKLRTTMGSGMTKSCFVALDGRSITKLPVAHEYIIDGDARVKSIAAASIIAKVWRDRLMRKLSKQFPPYGFDVHKGYGTAAHWKALDSAGPSPLHRQSFLVKYHARRNQKNLL